MKPGSKSAAVAAAADSGSANGHACDVPGAPEPSTSGPVAAGSRTAGAGSGFMRGKGAIRSHEAVPVEAREREVARLEAIIKLTRLEAATLHNKAQLELQERDAEVQMLKRTVKGLREAAAKSKLEMQVLEQALRTYRAVDADQQRTLAKSSSSAEAQLRKLRKDMQDMQLAHEQAQAQAQAQVDAISRERAAMCQGLAAVAQQAIGGPDAAKEDLTADAEAALASGEEPIPRNPSAWSHLKFHLDDKGNLASFTHGPSSHLKPFDRDGARGVAALCAQVARLYKQRGALRAKAQSAASQAASVQGALERGEFTVMADLVCDMGGTVDQLMELCRPPAPDPGAEADGTDSKSHEVWQLVSGLALRLATARQELQALRPGVLRPSQRSRLAGRPAVPKKKGRSKSPAELDIAQLIAATTQKVAQEREAREAKEAEERAQSPPPWVPPPPPPPPTRTKPKNQEEGGPRYDANGRRLPDPPKPVRVREEDEESSEYETDSEGGSSMQAADEEFLAL